MGLRSLTEAIDTTTAGGKLVFHIFAALAEFERGVIRERTLAGLQAARARDHTGGRPPALKAKDLAAAKALLLDPEITVVQVAKRLGVAASTLYAICRGRGPRPWKPEPEPPMPIKPELRYFYPIDWPQISHWVRFVRAKGRCQVCGRPHGETVRIWAMAAGGMRRSRPGGTAEVARSPRLPCRGCAAPDDQGRAGGSPSRSRPGPLWAAAPQRPGAVPTMPPAP